MLTYFVVNGTSKINLSGPNVKSFPHIPDDPVQEFWISFFTDLNHSLDHPLTCSYSPCPQSRGELIRDDFCMVREQSDRYRLYSGAFQKKFRVIGPKFTRKNGRAVASAPENMLPDLLTLSEKNPRAVSRELLRRTN